MQAECVWNSSGINLNLLPIKGNPLEYLDNSLFGRL